MENHEEFRSFEALRNSSCSRRHVLPLSGRARTFLTPKSGSPHAALDEIRSQRDDADIVMLPPCLHGDELRRLVEIPIRKYRNNVELQTHASALHSAPGPSGLATQGGNVDGLLATQHEGMRARV